MIKKYSKEQVSEILETKRNYREAISIANTVLNISPDTIKDLFSERNG